MTLSNQAVGALMMALQKSLMEQSDIVPVLQGMEFVSDGGTTLNVTNPPVVSLEGVEVTENTEEESTVLIPEG